MIYFITQENKYVKIGYSELDPQKRLCALQIGNPISLSIYKVVEGNKKLEGEIHERFLSLNGKGEWFYFAKDLKEYIDSLIPSEWKPSDRNRRKGTKKQITLRIDEEVLEWFKAQGKGYQGRMNDALRKHMNYEGGKSALDYVDLREAIGERDAGSMISHPVATKTPKGVTTATVTDQYFKPMPKTGKKKK